MLTPRAADDARRPLCAARARPPLGAAVLVTALVLGGCTGGPSDEPTGAPTATDVPTPEPTPTPTPTTTPEPERPAAMDDPGVDGAVAAATYFLSLYPYVYNTGDLTAWKSLSHPECIFCGSVVTGVEEMHALGQRQEGTDLTVTPRGSAEIETASWFSVELSVEQGNWIVVDEKDDLIRSGTADNYDFVFAVVREDEQWLVRAVEASPAA